LDELQGIIVGVLHEALTGKDYQEIEAIFEAENLFTLKNDYRYGSSIRYMYENKNQWNVPGFYQPPAYDETVQQMVKIIVENKGKDVESIQKLIHYVEENLNWKSKLTLLPYTKDKEKFDYYSQTNNYYQENAFSQKTNKWMYDIEEKMLETQDID